MLLLPTLVYCLDSLGLFYNGRDLSVMSFVDVCREREAQRQLVSEIRETDDITRHLPCYMQETLVKWSDLVPRVSLSS